MKTEVTLQADPQLTLKMFTTKNKVLYTLMKTRPCLLSLEANN